MTIMGDLRQNPGGPTYEAIWIQPWSPAVVFTSETLLAEAVDPGLYGLSTDTLFDDEHWASYVAVELDPAQEGSNSVRVVTTSFNGGFGGPLPGGSSRWPKSRCGVPTSGSRALCNPTRTTSVHLNGTFPSPRRCCWPGWERLAWRQSGGVAAKAMDAGMG